MNALLAESIRQPRQPPHLHSDREVLAFYVGRADLRGVGIAHDWDLLRIRYVGRAVPVFALGVVNVYLDESREVATVGERGGDGLLVGLESVGRDLEPLGGSCGPQSFDENIPGGVVAAAECKIQD
jgi:hypothetical protein